MTMEIPNQNTRPPVSVSERTLREIVEQGFFGAPGTLADARSACAELIFARALIAAQTARISQLVAAAGNAFPGPAAARPRSAASEMC
jgi:hypothetical protein